MPLPPGGPLAAAFAATVDDLAAYLDAEAAAAAAEAAGGAKRAPAPAPGWAWTADRVLRLLQQHAGEGWARVMGVGRWAWGVGLWVPAPRHRAI